MAGATLGQTPFISLNLVNFDWYAWHDLEHQNFKIIDAVFGNLLGVKAIDGIWQNNMSVLVDEVYVDADLGTLWKALIAHTTAATGTFAADRTANPTYWVSTASGQVSELKDLTDVNGDDHVTARTQVLSHQAGTDLYKPVSLAMLLPVGTVLPFAGATPPRGALLCDGSGLNTTTYADLFAVIGYAFGGAGATFNLPDTRNRVIGGQDGTILTGYTRGANTHAISIAELPAHDHGVAGNHSHSIKANDDHTPVGNVLPSLSGSGFIDAYPVTEDSGSHSHASVGSGAAMDMKQLTLYMNHYIVYTNDDDNIV